TVDLHEEHDRLAHDYERYSDLHYAAYVTDDTTNRTEQRQFDIRISKEKIHVYISEAAQVDGLPLEFYLSTFYADGSPAKSRVTIYESSAQRVVDDPQPVSRGARLLSSVSTNQYGVAKVTGLRSDASDLFF